ncbi:hypothetical protein C8R44DRAFT_727576 [Mycena epipterygia]|nr:hypothetical protein C8R44DRAFT_727576 [Mycena epipterygia]
MSAFAHRTLRSNARPSPYENRLTSFHSAVPNYYPEPLANFFVEEWPSLMPYFENSASSPESALSVDSPPSTPPAYVEVAPTRPQKSAGRRGRPANHVPRPRNAFMIFRSEFWAKQKISKNVEVDHRHISRIVGILWNELPDAEKNDFRVKAELEKLEHQRLYPNYRFTPTVRAQKPLKRKVQRNGEKDLTRCREVAGLLLAGKQGDELEQAVMNLDKEAESDAQTVPAYSGRSAAPRAAPEVVVRGWPPQTGISETVDLLPILLPSPHFDYRVAELLSPPSPQFAPNYTSSLPCVYTPAWSTPNRLSYDTVGRLSPPPSVSIIPYDSKDDRPMVVATTASMF